MPIDVHSKNDGSPKNRKQISITPRRYPFAIFLNEPKAPSFYPRGITLHYTGGASAESSIEYLLKVGLSYHFLIDRDGLVFQMESLAKPTKHAGRASWKGLSPNKHHVSIAIANYGQLEPHSEGGVNYYKDWTGNLHDEVYAKDDKLYEPATDEQEQSLFDLCLWLCRAFMLTGEDICGHDECALPKGRKLDPGGIFSFHISKFRKMIDRMLPLQPEI